jgi:hypothetical protein
VSEPACLAFTCRDLLGFEVAADAGRGTTSASDDEARAVRKKKLRTAGSGSVRRCRLRTISSTSQQDRLLVSVK